MRGLNTLLKNRFPDCFVSGHDFSRAAKLLIFVIPSGLQPARNLLFVSRASPQCFPRMRTNCVSTRRRVRKLVGVRLLASGRNANSPAAVPHICQHLENMGHPANGKRYLDLKRTKTDAPGWRCATVCCLICCWPNFGGAGSILNENPCYTGTQYADLEAAWNVKLRPPCCGCQATNAISGILPCITGTCRVNTARRLRPSDRLQREFEKLSTQGRPSDPTVANCSPAWRRVTTPDVGAKLWMAVDWEEKGEEFRNIASFATLQPNQGDKTGC